MNEALALLMEVIVSGCVPGCICLLFLYLKLRKEARDLLALATRQRAELNLYRIIITGGMTRERVHVTVHGEEVQ